METENNTVKATITLDGQTHGIMISRERAVQIKRLQKLIKESKTKQNEANERKIK